MDRLTEIPMAPTATMQPPAIPQKHPGRLSKLVTNTPAPIDDRVSDNEIHLWHRGSDLYHGYEWQDAAEIFLHLSRTIRRDLESTLCLLNAATIYARLGDYTSASQVLEEAKQEDQTLGLVLYVMGHVEFQLGRLEKAHDCLQVALTAMKGPNQDFMALGMDVNLRAAQIKEDLRTLEGLEPFKDTLTAFTADSIFEAPERTPRSTRSSMTRSDSIDMPSLSDGSSTPPPLSPVGSIKTLEYRSDGVEWHDAPEEPEIQIALPSRSSSLAKGVYTPIIQEYAPSIPSTRSPSRDRPRRIMEPREARVQGDSTQELAGFIRDLPRPHRLEPRGAADVDFGNMHDIANFLRDGPELIPGTPRRALSSRCSVSSMSIYSTDLRPESVGSDELVSNGVRQWHSRSVSPASSRYRSGLGSVLLNENGSRPHMPRRTSSRSTTVSRASTMQSPTPGPSHTNDAPEDRLHQLLCDSTITAPTAWPLVEEAADGLRRISLHSETWSQLEKSQETLPPPQETCTAIVPVIRPTVSRRSSIASRFLKRRPSSASRRTGTTSLMIRPPKLAKIAELPETRSFFKKLNSFGAF